MVVKKTGKNGNTKKPDLWLLRLYISGHTAKADAALSNLKAICEEMLKGKYDIEVIDLLKQPQFSKEDGIIATPALVRKLPPPVRKIIGDLSNKERVLVGLELLSRPWPGNVSS